MIALLLACPNKFFNNSLTYQTPYLMKETITNHFQRYNGHLTTEYYMPSKKETKVASSNSTGSYPMTAQYAKDTETCTECFKPRVIYGEKLTKSEVNDYKRTLEDNEYTCGSPIRLCGAGFI